MLDSKGEVVKRDKPNWREAFEWVLRRGGAWAFGSSECAFCQITKPLLSPKPTNTCFPCPLDPPGAACYEAFRDEVDNSERRTICRYVLKHNQDFTDRDEIRGHIADALTVLGKDDACEKFLWKAEESKKYYAAKSLGYYGVIGAITGEHHPSDIWPDLRYLIAESGGPYIIAFRDEDTHNKVLAFLNGEKDA